jgi:hypothetical protein
MTAQYVTSGVAEFGENPNIIQAANLTTNTLTPIFEGIATSLPGIQYNQSVTITITGPGSIDDQEDSENCNFAAVFNGKQPGASDVVAIKGKVVQDEETGKYKMINVKYKGITSPPSITEVTESGRRGIKVDFNFAGLAVPAGATTISQFKYDGSAWNAITGADVDIDSSVTVIPAEKKTAVVILILDAAMQDINNIANVRTAAGAFVQKLYEQNLQQQ